MKSIDRKLFEAIQEGNLNTVKALLAKGANINVRTDAQIQSDKERNTTGLTPLIYAVLEDRIEIAKYLLNQNADITVRDDKGNDLLNRSCFIGQLEIASACIKKGADVNAKNDDGQTPLMGACFPLPLCQRNNDLEIVKLLLEKGVNINEQDNDHFTALMRACISVRESIDRNDLEIIKLLLEEGTDVNLRNYNGSTALCIACSSPGNIEISRLLLDHGAEVNIQTNDGQTPLIEAANIADLQTVQLLLEKGANPDHKDKYGLTALNVVGEDCIDPDENVIQQIKQMLKQASGKSGGCYIATACYGSYNAPEVLILRTYRDKKLAHHIVGKLGITLYYKCSPYIARYLHNNPVINALIKTWFLDPIVNYLKKRCN